MYWFTIAQLSFWLKTENNQLRDSSLYKWETNAPPSLMENDSKDKPTISLELLG